MVRHSTKGTNVRKSGYIFEYRFTLLGGAKTGKTSVMNRFISNTFTHRYRPTIEDHITHTIDHKGNICVCLLVDTCGRNDFPAMRRLAITKGNAFLLVYSIDNRKSFIEAKRTADEIISLKDAAEDVKILLIGNKTDLSKQREVERREGEELVDELNIDNVSSLFFEVSAAENEGIENIFTSLLNMFLPEQNEVIYTPEKSAFSRMSFRRKSKKEQLRKKKNLEMLDTKKELNYFSDTEVPTPKSNSLPTPTQRPKLVRSSSATSHLTDSSDSSFETSPTTSPVFGRRHQMLRRESSAKEILRKTFGSMQKLFIKHSENNHNNNHLNNNNNSLKRSLTADNAMSRTSCKKNETTV